MAEVIIHLLPEEALAADPLTPVHTVHREDHPIAADHQDHTQEAAEEASHQVHLLPLQAAEAHPPVAEEDS